nr:DUF2267 domain-containing protein [Planosporangium mesophilum]
MSPELAERLTRAVLRTLAERIDSGEADDLAGYLPEQVRGYLVKDRISAEGFTLPEFVRRVQLRAEVDPVRAENAVRAVLSVLHDAVEEAEWAELMAQLSLDFRGLFEAAPGSGPGGPSAPPGSR